LEGKIQVQVGWGSEQCGLVVDVPAHCRGVGLETFKGPFQPKLFYDSTKNTYKAVFLVKCLRNCRGVFF